VGSTTWTTPHAHVKKESGNTNPTTLWFMEKESRHHHHHHHHHALLNSKTKRYWAQGRNELTQIYLENRHKKDI